MDTQQRWVIRGRMQRTRARLWLGCCLAAMLGAGSFAFAGDRSAPGSGKKPAGARLSYIDQLIEDGWQKASVKPSGLARDEEFLRRAYLDLVGRIPNVAEARAFLTTRESDKRPKLIEYLLDHPDYAKNFATEWTVLLIGRGNQGRMVDRASLSTWLRKQFAGDRPWNEVVRELVSSKGSNKDNGAVNYVLAHLEFDAVPLTSLTTRLFLGQQIQCTQCHDHPSNQWKQDHFWGINAFFKGIKAVAVTKPSATGMDTLDHYELSDEPSDAYVRFERRNGLVGVAMPKFLDGRKISQGMDVVRRDELGKLIADPDNEALAKAFVNRMWAHFLGRGFVHPVDDFGSHNPPSHPELLDRLAKDFKESGFDVKQLCRWIMMSRAYQLSSMKAKGSEKEDGLFNQMQLKAMSPEQLFDSLMTATRAHHSGSGDPDHRKRDAWASQFLFAFANDEGDESSGFQGTIPQALLMMNGEMMCEALSGKPGSFLGDVIDQAQRQGRSPEAFMVDSIYVAALSRHPSPKEVSLARQYFQSFPDGLQVLQDLFWALLNSNEFVLIH
jgi:Protein of unknown function (DUF1549)/Protein of unknown function (DUF1553)